MVILFYRYAICCFRKMGHFFLVKLDFMFRKYEFYVLLITVIN